MTATLPETSATIPADLETLAERMRVGQRRGRSRDLAWRIQQLRQMQRMLTEREDDFIRALAQDVGKPATEAWVTDLAFVTGEIAEMIKHLPAWAADEKVRVPAKFKPGTARIVREPLGACLVIAPWNYPIQLLLLPMACAIAAGNAVVGKPSEVTPTVSACVARWTPEYLDTDTVAIVEGGVPETTALLAQQWDHIFYTGNGAIGRVVMRAAAEHLTPVTLELGGKSPTIVTADADIEVAGRRIAWGKGLNAGQTCVAPDYVLVHRSVQDRLQQSIAQAWKVFYGDDPQRSGDFARIVSPNHWRRLTGLLAGGGYDSVVTGGASDERDRFIAPTLLQGVHDDAPVMADEIFGPILPVIAVDDTEEAIAYVNARPKPLALYVFTGSKATAEHVVDQTSSGGVSINATLMHLTVPGLPFGGVGPSGMGAYHGKTGFETFSHRKSVFDRPTRPDAPILYPPYSGWKQKLLRKVL